ncbi:TIGR03862 family flavoprotein [Polaribacter pectinis]|uniref:TIGR03862 family flavoprotein n=1 Tax=Polaribacter pectinis TaxID=2738844 RepID=A0A7G9L847_9FLAO|nr:TIGR03862 family flavoprotein [Polaribacter pectinis]QNM84796.1 TIGR03862 family flavoprotein [Polaribacter pectinis]
MKNITIIGGGPAALMLAAEIDIKKYKVTICEKKKTVGRKFLVAGEGGLNLTFNSTLEALINQYSPSEFMDAAIRKFTNEDLVNWLNKHKIPTFTGSSNRVFPEQGLKPSEVLKRIVTLIKEKGVEFQFNKKWIGWNEKGNLCFENSKEIKSDITVFALGGASWKVTGSDGEWSEKFQDKNIEVKPFRAANCAFSVDWDKNFIKTQEGKPLKNIALTYKNHSAKGELVISKFGLEGNALYAISEKIQNTLLTEENTTIHLDLKPTLTVEQLKTKYKKTKLSKVTEILKKDLNLDRTSISILKHFTDKETFSNEDLLVKAIKSLPIVLKSAEEIDKAISTLGGISLDEVDENFQLKKIPNSYTIGEMLEWYAPTGGYLLQGSFSMGFYLAKHLNTL